MFCPNCGANNSTDQKFCRSCGLNLEQTAVSLLEQIPSAESAKLLRRDKSLEKFGTIAFTGFALVLLTGLGAFIYFIIKTMILTGSSVLGGVLLIVFFIFSALLLVYVGLKEDLKERRQKANPQLNNELSGKMETAKLLEEKPFESIQSVTENSTQLLPVENKTRKLE